jgi:hypothetical protein
VRKIGLEPAEFEELLAAFRIAWAEYVQQRYSENKERQRKPGGGRKPILNTMEGKLLFILFYFKTYLFTGLFAQAECEASHSYGPKGWAGL